MKRLFVSMLVLLLCISFAAHAQDESDEGELQDLSGDFKVTRKKDYKDRKKFFLIGRVIDGKFNVIHYNDEDMLGFTSKIGWPKDDDIGRTARLDLNYNILAENGRIDFDFYNQLFSHLPDPENDEVQEIMEETQLAIRMRIVQSEEQQLYFIVGGSFTNQYGRPLLMAYLQEMLHASGGGTIRENIESDLNRNFFNFIFGAGKKFDLLNTKKVKVFVIAETEIQLSTEFDKESNATLRATMGINVAGWRSTDNPVFRIRAHGGSSLYGEGRIDYQAKLDLNFSLRLTKNSDWYLEPGISAGVIYTDEDETYEGGPSYNTGIHIEIRKRKTYEEDSEGHHFLFEDFD